MSSARQRIRMAVAWGAVFILPVLPFTESVPHAPFLFVPLLVALHGLSGPGRALLTIGIPLLLYEAVFHLSLGTLFAPFAGMMVLHLFLARVIRVERRGMSSGSSMMHTVSALVVFIWWHAGLVVLASAWGFLMQDALSWDTAWGLWRQQSFGISIGVSAVLVALIGIPRAAPSATGVFPI